MNNSHIGKDTARVGSGLLIASLLFAMAIIVQHDIGQANATSSSVTTQANVVVSSFCTITSLSNTIVNFGSIAPGSGATTGNLVIVKGTNGNVNGNIMIEGTNMVSGQNNVDFIGNVLWNPASAGQGIGNGIKLSNGITPGNYADTTIFLPSGTNNNIYFGLTTLSSTQPIGDYGGNAILVDYCAGTGNSINSNVQLVFNVPGTCGITLSNSLINFGSVNPGSGAAVGNLITDTNTNGNVNANVYVEGSNWISGANNFYVANTLWNPTSVAAGIGNAVFLAPSNFVDTRIPVNTLSANNIYFGVNVPAAQAAATYTSNIIIENFC